MKKFLIPAIFFIAFTTAAFADGKKSNTQLFHELKSALKTVDASAWVSTGNYAKTTFAMNGKNVSAFINSENGNLIGFSVPIDANALPEGTIANLDKKFHGWKMINPIMFLTEAGKIDYYIQVVKQGESLALSVSGNGRLGFYGQISK